MTTGFAQPCVRLVALMTSVMTRGDYTLTGTNWAWIRPTGRSPPEVYGLPPPELSRMTPDPLSDESSIERPMRSCLLTFEQAILTLSADSSSSMAITEPARPGVARWQHQASCCQHEFVGRYQSTRKAHLLLRMCVESTHFVGDVSCVDSLDCPQPFQISCLVTPSAAFM